MKPSISIILPNFNSYLTISKTIKSILDQSYQNWRLIIIDDNSDIKTKKILSTYKNNKKIKIIFLKKNSGAGYCRNFALKKTKSNYIAFIDSDDVWLKDKLKFQINFMIKNNYDFTYTNYKTFSNYKSKINFIKPPQKFDFNNFVKNTSIGTSTMMIKSSLAKKSKFAQTKICEDYYYKCQILKKIKYAYCLPKVLTKYQISKNSLQSNKVRNLYWMWKINKNYNKFNFFKNLCSVFFISLNSLKKYGFK